MEGLTRALFHEVGKEPELMNALIMERSGVAMTDVVIFKRLAGIPSRPVLLWELITDSLEQHSVIFIVCRLRLPMSGGIGVGLTGYCKSTGV